MDRTGVEPTDLPRGLQEFSSEKVQANQRKTSWFQRAVSCCPSAKTIFKVTSGVLGVAFSFSVSSIALCSPVRHFLCGEVQQDCTQPFNLLQGTTLVPEFQGNRCSDYFDALSLVSLLTGGAVLAYCFFQLVVKTIPRDDTAQPAVGRGKRKGRAARQYGGKKILPEAVHLELIEEFERMKS